MSSVRTQRAPARRARSGLSFEDMAARRAERLVNLVICLLSTRQFLTAERIRDAVPGYEAADGSRATDEAFKRMFERDKAELRDLGIPLETGRNSGFDGEDGYRIRRRDYELPPIEFDAARTATVVQFDYVKAGSDEPERRTLEPWGVLSWRRRWYVAGLDRDRGEQRSFRLSRITGPVTALGDPGAFERPEHVDLLSLVAGRRPDEGRTARVRVTGSRAGQLRRLAESERDGVLSIRMIDTDYLARLVAGAGTAAVALEPPDLVAAVVDRLRTVARAAGPA